jgi:membrane carboxypeptidase/penicillin-binding protein PbpC
MRRVLGVAEQFGLGRMPSNPSVVLGTAEVTPVRLTAAYAAFATLGQRAGAALRDPRGGPQRPRRLAAAWSGWTASSTRPPRS